MFPVMLCRPMAHGQKAGQQKQLAEARRLLRPHEIKWQMYPGTSGAVSVRGTLGEPSAGRSAPQGHRSQSRTYGEREKRETLWRGEPKRERDWGNRCADFGEQKGLREF